MRRDVPDLQIRLGRVEERAELAELQRRASLANAGDRDAILANPDAIDLPEAQLVAGQVFVGERAGALLGFSAVLDRPDGDTELDGLFVEPSSWRRGIGAQLVDRALRYAAERGAGALHVIANPHAARFYDACGFQQYGHCETEFGPGTLMRVPIRSACPSD